MVQWLRICLFHARDIGLMLESGRFRRGRNGNPVQHSCLENPKDRGACGLESALACPPSSLAWVEPLLILYQSSNPQTVLGTRFMWVDCYAESRVQSPETMIQQV